MLGLVMVLSATSANQASRATRRTRLQPPGDVGRARARRHAVARASRTALAAARDPVGRARRRRDDAAVRPGRRRDDQRRQLVDPFGGVRLPAVGVPQARRDRFLADLLARHEELAPPRTASSRSRCSPRAPGVQLRAGRPRVGDRARRDRAGVGLDRRRADRHVASIGSSAHAPASLVVVRARAIQPAHRVPRHRGQQGHLAWQSWQGLLSIANGGMTGSGIGGSNSQARLPAATPTATSSSRRRRRARLHRAGRRRSAGSPARLVRHPDRAGRARPVRHAARRRHRGMVRRAGDRQPRRGRPG